MLLSTVAISLATKAILFLGLTADLRSEEFTIRERAEKELTYLIVTAEDWQFVHRLHREEESLEAKARLRRAFLRHTARIADELIPAWHPFWPEIDKRDYAYEHFVSYTRERRQAWSERSESVNYYPPWWWEMYLHRRLAARWWAVTELNNTGDIAAVRRTVEEWAEVDRDYLSAATGYISGPEFCDPVRLTNFAEGGELSLAAYQTAGAIAPTLINRSYFDGRRRPYPGKRPDRPVPNP